MWQRASLPVLPAAIELIVHQDHGPAGRVEEGCGDRGAVTSLAVHPHLARGQLGEAPAQLVHGDVHGPVDVGGVPFLPAADIQDHHWPVATDGFERLGRVARGRQRAWRAWCRRLGCAQAQATI